MAATSSRSRSGIRATARARLRVDKFDAVMAQLGATTRERQAELCGTERTNLTRIRKGEISPSLELAMHMASRLSLPVEELFELVER